MLFRSIQGTVHVINAVDFDSTLNVDDDVTFNANFDLDGTALFHCDIEDGKVISGFPAMENKSWLRSSSIFKKLPELAKKLRQLDKS